MLSKRDKLEEEKKEGETQGVTEPRSKIAIPSLSCPLATFSEFVFSQIDTLPEKTIEKYFKIYKNEFIEKRIEDVVWEMERKSNLKSLFKNSLKDTLLKIKQKFQIERVSEITEG